MLVEEACDEVIDKVLNGTLSQSVQELAARKVANELSAHCAPCDIFQGDEVGSSAVEELTIRKDNFAINYFPGDVKLMNKLCNMAKKIEANPTNGKTMIKFCKTTDVF